MVKYNDFCSQMDIRERKTRIKDNLIAKEILCNYYSDIYNEKKIFDINCSVEELILLYFSLKSNGNDNILKKVLENYKFNYSMSIHNAIYYLLAVDKEYDSSISPLLWPGINDIMTDGVRYVLDTILGKIEVYKASEILSYSNFSFVFDRKLMGKCHDRTYDVLKNSNEYKAVLSYMPNFFYGGHYHSYLETIDSTLDIAANALYYSKDSIDKILCGDILAKLTYKQVQNKFRNLRNVISDIDSKNKLLTLSLYYDQK